VLYSIAPLQHSLSGYLTPRTRAYAPKHRSPHNLIFEAQYIISRRHLSSDVQSMFGVSRSTHNHIISLSSAGCAEEEPPNRIIHAQRVAEERNWPIASPPSYIGLARETVLSWCLLCPCPTSKVVDSRKLYLSGTSSSTISITNQR
jgi:hypothetical protein